MNILFPIAGNGTRVTNKDGIPKVLFKVNNKSMLEYSIPTLNLDGNYIFVTRHHDKKEFDEEIEHIIRKFNPNSIILYQTHKPIGMADSCLVAERYINSDEPLVITNADQYLKWNVNTLHDIINEIDPDACVSLYEHGDITVGATSPYSHVKLDDRGFAIEFAEKRAISKHALNGIYYWKHGSDFVDSVKRMVTKNIRVNNEFYIAPSFNEMISDGKRIFTFKMSSGEFYSLGTLRDIDKNYNYIN